VRGIVFLDRDGTLVEDTGYLADPASVREIAGAAAALSRLSGAGFRLAVISNQAGLARGKFDEAAFRAVHEAFVGLFLAQGVRFDAVEYCPHHPDGIREEYRAECDCRKPGSALPRKVLARYPEEAGKELWFVGDKGIDVETGRSVGARTVLVRTGHGREEERRLAPPGEGGAEAVVDDIAAAAEHILAPAERRKG
jgi:D-glycero-D-manno-heptose 1,7-bisphosphate phosphatase